MIGTDLIWGFEPGSTPEYAMSWWKLG